MYVFCVWEGETECLHSLILCVCKESSLHQLILHVSLHVGRVNRVLINTTCVCGKGRLSNWTLMNTTYVNVGNGFRVLALINMLSVFVGRGERVLALIRVDRMCALIKTIYVYRKEKPRE